MQHQTNHPNAPAIIPTPEVREMVSLLDPDVYTTTGNQTGVDMIDVGPELSFAVLHVGVVGGTATPTLTVTLQESSDDNTYTTIAAFDNVLAADIQKLSFTRTKQYLRVALTISGTNPEFTCGVSVGH